MTVNELVNYVRNVCPDCTVECEDDGNIIIVTNMSTESETYDGELIPMDIIK